MENEKNLNENPAVQELPDESLDTIAGGSNSGSVSYRFNIGNKVRFAMTDSSSLPLDGVVQHRYLKEYNGQTTPHYTIIANHYTGSTTYRDVPQHRIRYA